MNWWQRWKAKHWDLQVIKNEPGAGVFFIGLHKPPLRRFLGWFAKHWREQPLNFLMAAAALFGVAATVIQWLR